MADRPKESCADKTVICGSKEQVIIYVRVEKETMATDEHRTLKTCTPMYSEVVCRLLKLDSGGPCILRHI